jgi:hypothetical protein
MAIFNGIVRLMGVGGSACEGVGIAARVAGVRVLVRENEKVDQAGYVVVVAARCLEA